jgi:pyridoxal phosphate enzyme (YggS family)
MPGGIEGALTRLSERIDVATERAGRPHGAVRVLLATKTVPVEQIRDGIGAGFCLIGENRVQEMAAKGPALADLPHETHLLGVLQSNKINAALRWADCIQSIDHLGIARKVAARAAGRARELEVMIEVNTTGEATKAGCPPDQALELAAQVAALEHLRVTGFMTVGPLTGDQVAIGRAYALLRGIGDSAQRAGLTHAAELSMGMSGDLEIAVAEGATMVRVGRAVFGERPAPG